jgi:hypothetical protein
LIAQIGRLGPVLPQKFFNLGPLPPRTILRQEIMNKRQIVREAVVGIAIDLERERPIGRRCLTQVLLQLGAGKCRNHLL